MADIKYGYWEGLAARVGSPPSEGWCFSDTKKEWVEMSPADAMSRVKLLSKAEFDSTFPSLPPLPTEAFKDLT
jgi:hypothetical protein